MLDQAGFLESVEDAVVISDEVVALHARCGVYTKASMVNRILDEVGWTAEANLSKLRLLEPAAGDGAFVAEAARRLLLSMRRQGSPISPASLENRILAFELHETEAAKGRARLHELLVEAGLDPAIATSIATDWLRTGDFLLFPLTERSFTHVAGNPPYARWSKIPPHLRAAYEAALPREVAKGDLFLPFLDRGIAALKSSGKLGFLCSNRWQYMAFAEGFRTDRLPQVDVLRNEPAQADEVYDRSVDIYPSILVLQRRCREVKASAVRRTRKTLKEAGFDVRVGPALGCTEAYVIPPDCSEEIEAELLAPWVKASDVQEGQIKVSGKRVICLYDEEGRLRDPTDFPRAYAHLLRFKRQLEERSIVVIHKAPWYRPIDRVYAAAWRVPKLLIPELAKTPRIALDTTGVVPSHGVYAIVSVKAEADVGGLYRQLEDGGLSRALEGCTPRVKGGYVRCYKRFLEEIEI